jgi:hypothetical protein
VAAGMDVTVLPDAQPDHNIFIRSDQYNFIRAGVPSIMNAFAATLGTVEEKTMKDWLANRYHHPPTTPISPLIWWRPRDSTACCWPSPKEWQRQTPGPNGNRPASSKSLRFPIPDQQT